MPRPRTVSDEDLLDAVLALAHRIGPNRVTFAAVATEVGLSAATLVQRFGSKRGMLLAADRRGVDLWVGSLDQPDSASPLERVEEGLAGAVAGIESPEEMANSVALLQLDLSDADFHAETLRGARAIRAGIERELVAAIDAGELRSGTDPVTLAILIETVYHGALIGWAIHREGSPADWLRGQVRAALAPYRSRPESD